MRGEGGIDGLWVLREVGMQRGTKNKAVVVSRGG